MYQVETDSQTTTTTTTANYLLPVQWTRRPVWNWFCRTIFAFQRLHVLLTAVDVFSRHVFAIPLRRRDARLIVKSLMSIFTRHAYVLISILMDKGTTLSADVVKRTMEKAGISFEHARIEHAQTISVIERTPQEPKTILEVNNSANQLQWDQFVDTTVMAQYTTYHASMKCAPKEIFLGRKPHSALDLKVANLIRVTTQPMDISKTLDEVNRNYKQKEPNIVTAYQKCKTYYDRKASAQLLKVNEFVFLWNPKNDDQSLKQHFKSFDWQKPYKVMKVLSNSNYVIEQIGTHKTQCVHRMRLQPFVLHDEIEDIQVNQKCTDTNAVEDTDFWLFWQKSTSHTRRY